MSGFGRMPMPMPFGGTSEMQPYPTSTSSTGISYPTFQSQPSPYPIPTPSSFISPQQQKSAVNLAEIQRWRDELIGELYNIIKDASKSDLEQLVNNEDRLNDLILHSEQIKKLQRKRDELASENKDQAVTNITLQPEIDIKTKDLVELAKIQNQLQEKYLQLRSKLSCKVSLDSILAILQAITAETEAESDKISQDFLDKSKSVDEFLELYIPKRTIFQLRKMKAEKMTHLMESLATRINQPTPMPRLGRHGGYGGY